MKIILDFFMRAFLIAGCFAASACTSITEVKSPDPEVTLKADENSWKGTLIISDRKTFWQSTDVWATKPGCKDLKYVIPRFDEASPAAILGAPLTYGISLLWMTSYRRQYEIDYKCYPQAEP